MDRDDERAARRIERRVLRFVEQQALLPPGETVVLAVSGGPDSLAMLYILARLRDRLGVALAAAYVDHGIRPADEVEEERRFVAAAATALDVPFLQARAELPSPGRHSLEQAAREGRYRALARLAAEAGAARVATGHTRSDQAET